MSPFSFPVPVFLSGFSAQPGLDRRLVQELATGRFLDEGRNVMLLGPPGVGKTNLGIMTAERGHRATFTTTVDLTARLTRSMETNRLHRATRVMTQAKLLIIDEVGYLSFDAARASLLFQMICQRIPEETERGLDQQ